MPEKYRDRRRVFSHNSRRALRRCSCGMSSSPTIRWELIALAAYGFGVAPPVIVGLPSAARRLQ
jgi:hypothetical protein